MSVTVLSTTDTHEAANATIGALASGEVVKPKPASGASQDEIKDAKDSGAEAKEVVDKSPPAKVDEGIDDDELDDEPKLDADGKPRKKGGFKKRIDKLNAKISLKDQEIEHWRKEALKAKGESVAEKKVETAPKASDVGKPKAENFNSHEEYIEAVTDWKLDQREKVKESKDKEVQVKTEFQKKIDTHRESVKAFAKEHADFDELIEDINDVPMSITVQQVILESDHGPELMYELAKNREEYERICKLPAIAAARELGKFESKFIKEKESNAVETKTTKAPAPLKTVGSKAGGSIKNLSDPNLSQREYEEIRAQQMKARGQ
jgi:flagellum-specific peptidoglycan hydrolase FlgJ